MVVLIVAAYRQVTIAGVCSLSGVICLSCLVSGSVIVAADRQATIAGVCCLSGVMFG